MSTHAEAVDTARTKLLDLLDKLCKVEVPTARENVESIVDVANTLSYLRNDSPVNNDSPVITAANTAGTVTDTKPEQGPEPTPMTGNGAVAPDTRVNPGVMFERLLDRLAANCKCPNCTARRAAAGAGPEVPVTISGDIAPTFRVITVPLGATPEEAIAKGMAEVLAEQLLHRNG